MAITISSNTNTLSRIDYTQIEDEITLFFRNNLVDRKGRTNNNTETFTPDGDTVLFELTGDLDSKSRHKVTNIRTLNIDGTPNYYYTNYVCGFKLRTNNLTTNNNDIGKIRFWNAPTGSLITVNYDHTYNFVWPNNNRVDISTIDYPRVTLDVSGESEDLGLGGVSTVNNLKLVVHVNDSLIEGVRDLIMQIKNLFIKESVKKGFHNFTYIKVSKISDGPNVNSDDSNDVVWSQTITMDIPNQFEYSGNC